MNNGLRHSNVSTWWERPTRPSELMKPNPQMLTIIQSSHGIEAPVPTRAARFPQLMSQRRHRAKRRLPSRLGSNVKETDAARA